MFNLVKHYEDEPENKVNWLHILIAKGEIRSAEKFLLNKNDL